MNRTLVGARLGLVLLAFLGASWLVRQTAGLGVATFLTDPRLYLLMTVIATVTPNALPFQVILGQVLVGRALLSGAVGVAMLGALLGVVVLVAELLGLQARMMGTVARDPRGELPRVGVVTVVAVGVFTLVFWVGMLPGPTGLVSVVVVSAALIGLALGMARGGRGEPAGVPSPGDDLEQSRVG